MKKSLNFYLFYFVLAFQPFLLNAADIKVNGFVAQGIIQAKDSNFVNDEGDISAKLTEIGINASYRVNSRFRLAGQAVYLNGGNRYPEGMRLDYLFLESQIINGQDWQVKSYLGRNKNYHWLYSSTRDVPHTRPSIVLPQSLYFDAFRDVALGVDGLAVVAQTYNQFGEWDLNLSLGSATISDEQKQNLLGSAATGKLKHDMDKQFSVYFRPIASKYQFGVSVLDADFSYQPSIDDRYFDGEETSQRLMFNLLYQGQDWEVASEVMRERVIIKNVIFPGFSNDATAEGGYIQIRNFFSEKLTLLARLDIYDRDRKYRNGSDLKAFYQGAVPGYFGFMDQATAGITWKVAKNIQLQAEIHRVKGAARLAPIFAPDIVQNDHKYWNMWAVQLMYRF